MYVFETGYIIHCTFNSCTKQNDLSCLNMELQFLLRTESGRSQAKKSAPRNNPVSPPRHSRQTQTAQTQPRLHSLSVRPHSSPLAQKTSSSPCHSLAVPQCKLHPLQKASTGIQSQALTVPMRTGKHTVIGGEKGTPAGVP